MGKKSMVEILEGVASAINGEHHPFPVAWPYRYGTIEPAPGSRLLIEIHADGTLVEVPVAHAVNRVVAWMRLHSNPDWFLTNKRAAEAVEMFMSVSTPIPDADIRPVRWLTEAGYAWQRLPWDLREGACPTWDTLMARISNGDAFRAFIGSLLIDDAKHHQYLWVHSGGGDGKGAINRFIIRVFGKSYRSKQPPGMNDKFWTYGLIGSRVVVFPDCNARAFVASGLFKSLTGGDPVDVEAKNRMSFTVKLCCKFIIFSNEMPTISSERADMRRIIFCDFEDNRADDERNAVDPTFEDRLWDEGGAFLSSCVQQYASMCPQGGAIPSNTADIMDWVSTVEEEHEMVFSKYFEVPKNPLYRTVAGVHGLSREQIELVTVNGDYLTEVLREAFPNDKKQQSAFRDWAKKKHGVTRKTVRDLDRNDIGKRYVGMCRRLQRVMSQPSQLYSATKRYD